ncbi:hypothetical protein M422DRAFT_159906, partial [Sphaerobolus stellatus SS14]
AFDKFCLLADDSNQVPKLRKKKYQNFKLSKAEWTLVELMHEVLAVTGLLPGLENLRKWYKRTDNSNTYFICSGMSLASFSF